MQNVAFVYDLILGSPGILWFSLYIKNKRLGGKISLGNRGHVERAFSVSWIYYCALETSDSTMQLFKCLLDPLPHPHLSWKQVLQGRPMIVPACSVSMPEGSDWFSGCFPIFSQHTIWVGGLWGFCLYPLTSFTYLWCWLIEPPPPLLLRASSGGSPYMQGLCYCSQPLWGWERLRAESCQGSRNPVLKKTLLLSSHPSLFSRPAEPGSLSHSQLEDKLVWGEIWPDRNPVRFSPEIPKGGIFYKG